MEPERWRRIEELCNASLDLPLEHRREFLTGACRGDPALFSEVESLLSHEESAEQFLRKPAVQVVAELIAREKKDEPDQRAGRMMSHFQVLERLGQGGMGIVYRGQDTNLGRQVALKFLPGDTGDRAGRQRFQREARAASSLNHPNICSIYEIGEQDGEYFIAMELLEGETLAERMHAGPLPIDLLLEVSIQLADALGAAHKKNILHRDIKPANIFITAQNQPKILDFGLAKLDQAAPRPGNSLVSKLRNGDAGSEDTGVSSPATVSDLPFSRTGVAMGTPGYMSPEQVRGDDLDARTDLFSLGSVLYEMATGKRAASGDSALALQQAILDQTPMAVGELNPEVPGRLEKIIGKALEKDREARYQSALELRADLEAVRGELQARPRRRWAIELAVVVLLSVIVAARWFTKGRSDSLPAPPAFKLTQLTANSAENPVLSGTISPDGRYLAYVDMKGIHVKSMQNGEIRTIPEPQEAKDQMFVFDYVIWFPDSVRIVAAAQHAGRLVGEWNAENASVWVGSVQNGELRKLRDHSVPFSISPDGSLISFGTNEGRIGGREIWLMGPNGEQARKLFEIGEDGAIGSLLWSPDGQQVLYFRVDKTGDALVTRDLKGGQPNIILSEFKNINDVYWLPDGRLIYSISEPGGIGNVCNYWIAPLDSHTGLIAEKPKRLTNWAGFCMNFTSATRDGKQLSFIESAPHATIYVAGLETSRTRILGSRHFTLDESFDIPLDWATDNKSIIFESNRSGQDLFYKQPLDGDTPSVIAAAAGGLSARVSPDGKWLMKFGPPKATATSGLEQRDLVRIPITGGTSEWVLSARAESSISCARGASGLCVIAERTEDGTHLLFSSFDAIRGRGPQVAIFDLDPDSDFWLFDISPDGTRIAASRSAEGPIQILSLLGQREKVVRLKGLNDLQSLRWAADGKRLYVSGAIEGGTALLSVDMQGNASILWNNRGGDWETHAPIGVPSPDGRNLAIGVWTLNQNIWLIENF
jgi:eukaryotic-like serine/threonine-protein kinase